MESHVGTTAYLYVVRCELIAPEVETAWNAWYDDTHVPAMLSVPGIHSVTRFAERVPAPRYLALYEIDSPDVFQHPRYLEARGWGEWARHIRWWSRAILRREGVEEAF